MKIIVTFLFVLVLAFGVICQSRKKPVKPKSPPKKEYSQPDIDALPKEAQKTFKKKDWEYLAESQKDVFYYRTIGVKNIDKDVVQFWVRKKNKEYLNDASQTLNLYQINCRTNQSKITHLTIYNSDGSVYLDDDTSDEFRVIKPNTYGEFFSEVICKSYWQK